MEAGGMYQHGKAVWTSTDSKATLPNRNITSKTDVEARDMRPVYETVQEQESTDLTKSGRYQTES